MLSQKDRTTAAIPTPGGGGGGRPLYTVWYFFYISQHVNCDATGKQMADREKERLTQHASHNPHHPPYCFSSSSCCLLALGFEYQLAQQHTHYHCCCLCWQEIKSASLKLCELGGSGVIATEEQKIGCKRLLWKKSLPKLMFPLCYCKASPKIYQLNIHISTCSHCNMGVHTSGMSQVFRGRGRPAGCRTTHTQQHSNTGNHRPNPQILTFHHRHELPHSQPSHWGELSQRGLQEEERYPSKHQGHKVRDQEGPWTHHDKAVREMSIVRPLSDWGFSSWTHQPQLTLGRTLLGPEL